MKNILSSLFKIIIFIIFIPFLTTLPSLIGISVFINDNFYLMFLVSIILSTLFTYLFRNKITKKTIIANYIYLVLSIFFFILFAIIKNGGIETNLMNYMIIVLFPYIVTNFTCAMTGYLFNGLLFSGISLLSILLSSFIFLKNEKITKKKVYISLSIIIILLFISAFIYLNRPEKKYRGHGFEYMQGYSSTDFKDYHVYSNPSKLITIEDDKISKISNNFPVMDGAEACYPLYASIAKTLYQDIDKIELYNIDRNEIKYQNGLYVTFTNSIVGFDRLINKEVDLFFGAKPSLEQLDYAKFMETELEIIPIAKEGFVFFVNNSNKIDNLTSKEIRDIYHENITNWQELGGNREEIMAFQRPENSGSQTMMKYFMGDVSLKEPKTFEHVESMGGIIKETAQYHNSNGAIGYSFRYFLEELNQEENIKILSVDGVYPNKENIANGTYSLTTNVYLIIRKDNTNESIQKVKEFILSKEGQILVDKVGYAKLEE